VPCPGRKEWAKGGGGRERVNGSMGREKECRRRERERSNEREGWEMRGDRSREGENGRVSWAMG